MVQNPAVQLTVSSDLKITSATLFNNYSGYLYSHVCSTNDACLWTKFNVVKHQNTSSTLSVLLLQWQHDLACTVGKLLHVASVYQFKERAFSYSGTVVWNKLPRNICAAPSLQDVWKQKLKTYLFKEVIFPLAWHNGGRWMFSAKPHCLWICLLVNTITSERLNLKWWNLVGGCNVKKSRSSSNFKVIGPIPSPHTNMWLKNDAGQWLRRCKVLLSTCLLVC